uniref:WD repeat-containing protein 37 n=2 Tax=Schistocephalus solidus TaxID=70667 RepID=A0A0X3PFL0_SCHSO
MLTCSGDGTAHLIRLPQKFFEVSQAGETSAVEPSNDTPAANKSHPSAEPLPSLTASQHDTEANADVPGNSVASTPMVIRDPTSVFQSATLSFGDGGNSTSLALAEGVVESAPLAAADFLSGRNHLVTASWDRLGRLYDVNTGQEVHSLTGHDHQLTDVRCAEQLPVVVTSARDSTFRLWDFRTPRLQIHVQQAHSRTVSTAQFLPSCPPDLLISAGTDRICRLWDLRKCRSPLFTIRTDAGINRLAVLQSGALLDARRRTSLPSTVADTSTALSAPDLVPSTSTSSAAAAASATALSCIFALPLDNRTVRFIDISGSRISRISRNSAQGHTRAITSVAWAGTGAYDLFTAGFDHQLLAWQLQIA